MLMMTHGLMRSRTGNKVHFTLITIVFCNIHRGAGC